MSATSRKSKPKTRDMLEREIIVNLAHFVTDSLSALSNLTKEHGISPVHHNVLRILRGADACGLPCGTISARMINKEPDITRLLDRMEKQDLIVRARDQADRRVVITRITEHGLKILAELDAPVAALQHQQFEHVSNEKLEMLLAIVKEIREQPK